MRTPGEFCLIEDKTESNIPGRIVVRVSYDIVRVSRDIRAQDQDSLLVKRRNGNY